RAAERTSESTASPTSAAPAPVAASATASSAGAPRAPTRSGDRPPALSRCAMGSTGACLLAVGPAIHRQARERWRKWPDRVICPWSAGFGGLGQPAQRSGQDVERGGLAPDEHGDVAGA